MISNFTMENHTLRINTALPTGVLLGEKHTQIEPGSISPKDMERQLLDCWTRTTRSMSELAETCTIALLALKEDQIKDIAERLGLDGDIFINLAETGGSDKVTQHAENLPPDVPTLHVLAQLKDDEFDQALKDGVINRKTNVLEVLRWQAAVHEKASDADDNKDRKFSVKTEMSLYEATAFMGAVKYVPGLFNGLVIERLK